MSAVAEDRFADFVRRVAALLDRATTADPAALAADAGFSRSQYDRIVTGLTGESPSHFVNRILLERAAYRMTTTSLPLLEIAGEAGYSSHEAFTRAFRRAYGSPPSVWRRRPGRFQLPAPSEVHFHPPGGLRLPRRAGAPSDDIVVQLVEQHVRLVESLVEQAAGVSEADLDAPALAGLAGIDGDTLRWALSQAGGPDGDVVRSDERSRIRLRRRGARERDLDAPPAA